MLSVLCIPEKYQVQQRKTYKGLLREARIVYHDNGLFEMIRYLFFPENKVEKILTEQLNGRMECTDKYWGKIKCEPNTIATICEIIKNVMYWPNAKYLPDDSLALLTMFWWDEDRLTYIIIAIEDRYGSIWDNRMYDINMENISLGEFIELIYPRIQEVSCAENPGGKSPGDR